MHKKSYKKEAEDMLAKMNEKYHTHAVFALCEANSDGDDIIVKGTRIPMLRQQKAVSGKPNLCLSDFLRPLSSGIKDTLGLFATFRLTAALTDDSKMIPTYGCCHRLLLTV